MLTQVTYFEDTATLWSSHLPGVELFQARLIHHAFSKHFHDAYTIGLNLSGQGQCFHQGTTHRNNPGTFNLLNPGEVHTGQVAQGHWAFRNLYISAPLMASLMAQLEQPSSALPHLQGPNIQRPALSALFQPLFQALGGPATLLTQQSRLLSLVAQLPCHRATPLPQAGTEPKAIARVRAYIDTHYADNFSLETLSATVNLSPYYLIRSFKKQMGLPPHSYQRQVRLLQAKRSLRTDKPLAAIAADNGFYDQSHLTRAFKRAFGVTPGQYRRQGNSVQYW
ncbi:MAG: AraC family transcriptional regulator [Cyanobacteria bacterium P01_A01_bin.135]